MNHSVLSIGLFMFMHMGIAGAQVPHIIGSWKLNNGASIYPGPVPRSQVRTYFPLDDGFLLGIAVTIDAQGNGNFLQFTAKTDGLDYPEYDAFSLAHLQMSGVSTSATYSETPLDEYTVEWVDKDGGEPSFSGTRHVSEDGDTLTIVFERHNPEGQPESYKLVYDRQ